MEYRIDHTPASPHEDVARGAGVKIAIGGQPLQEGMWRRTASAKQDDFPLVATAYTNGHEERRSLRLWY
jgi:hypothetical protein